MAAMTIEKMHTSIVNRAVWRRLGQVTFDNSMREAAKYSNSGFTSAPSVGGNPTKIKKPRGFVSNMPHLPVKVNVEMHKLRS
jgi:hypothetical protein